MKITNFTQIEEAACKINGRVVVPMANNEEAQTAVKEALADNWLKGGTLIGDKSKIEEVAKTTGLDLSRLEIKNIADPKEAATEAVRMMAKGEGDFLLKGIIDTKFYLRAILDKEFQMVPEGNLLCHVALMQIPGYHKLVALSDVAINIYPGTKEKIKIINNMVDIFHKMGIEKPKVAMICPVEKFNEKIESTVHAKEVVEHFQGSDRCVVEGPYDTYIALSKHAAEEKGVTGEVCGDADILIFPNLDSANPVYKLLNQFVAKIKSAAIVAGARIPVILPSRADSAQTKKLSIAFSSYLAQAAHAKA